MSKSFRRAVTFSDDEDSDAADAPQKASGPIILESLTTDDSGRPAETNDAVSPPPTKSMLIEKINGALSNDGYVLPIIFRNTIVGVSAARLLKHTTVPSLMHSGDTYTMPVGSVTEDGTPTTQQSVVRYVRMKLDEALQTLDPDDNEDDRKQYSELATITPRVVVAQTLGRKTVTSMIAMDVPLVAYTEGCSMLPPTAGFHRLRLELHFSRPPQPRAQAEGRAHAGSGSVVSHVEGTQSSAIATSILEAYGLQTATSGCGSTPSLQMQEAWSQRWRTLGALKPPGLGCGCNACHQDCVAKAEQDRAAARKQKEKKAPAAKVRQLKALRNLPVNGASSDGTSAPTSAALAIRSKQREARAHATPPTATSKPPTTLAQIHRALMDDDPASGDNMMSLVDSGQSPQELVGAARAAPGRMGALWQSTLVQPAKAIVQPARAGSAVESLSDDESESDARHEDEHALDAVHVDGALSEDGLESEHASAEVPLASTHAAERSRSPEPSAKRPKFVFTPPLMPIPPTSSFF